VGYFFSALIMRMTRSSVLEVFREDYVRSSRAKGLKESTVIRRSVLPNAMLPIVTLIGLEFAFLLGGLIVTEQVFNLNGLGLLFVQSVSERDYATTQALVLLVSVTFVVINFLVDVLYAALDPRIKYA
jgi:peptide/nickel transport system permease protein